jgi:hypothetical protein
MRNAVRYSATVEAGPNPFRYGGVALGDYFADREQELQTLTADVLGGQDVVIVSPRRHGKTSLVERAIEQWKRRQVKVAYVDLFAAQSVPEVADKLARGIFDGLLSRRRRAVEQAHEFVSKLSISPRITVGEDAKPQFEFISFRRDEDVLPVLEELLALPGEVAADSGRPVVLVLDEFQQVAEVDRALPARLRSAFQRQAEVAHVYLGSRRHVMNRLFMEHGEPLYRSAKPLPLGPIPPEQFAGFLRERFAAGEVEVTGEALERVLTITGGLPYETQELCSFAWTRALATRRSVDVELVHLALVDVLAAESARYVTIWDELPPAQRKLLRALAGDAGAVFSERYRREHRLGSASTVQRALEGLERRELVEPRAQEGHLISDIFLRLWLRDLDRGTR